MLESLQVLFVFDLRSCDICIWLIFIVLFIYLFFWELCVSLFHDFCACRFHRVYLRVYVCTCTSETLLCDIQTWIKPLQLTFSVSHFVCQLGAFCVPHSSFPHKRLGTSLGVVWTAFPTLRLLYIIMIIVWRIFVHDKFHQFHYHGCLWLTSLAMCLWKKEDEAFKDISPQRLTTT